MTSNAVDLMRALSEDRRAFERNRLQAEQALERTCGPSERAAIGSSLQRLARARYRLGLDLATRAWTLPRSAGQGA